jgi:hypothetical protein
MNGLYIENLHDTYHTILDFLSPIITEADPMFWAIDSSVGVNWTYLESNESIYCRYLFDLEPFTGQDGSISKPWSSIWENDLKLFKPQMLSTFGRYFNNWFYDVSLHIGIPADTPLDACQALSQVFGDFHVPPKINTYFLIKHNAIFAVKLANYHWAIFANDEILNEFKSIRQKFKKVNSTNGNYTSWWSGFIFNN